MAPVSALLVALALVGVAQTRSPIPHSEIFQTVAAEDEDGLLDNNYRLDGSIRPRSYDIRIGPDFENFATSGRVRIIIEATRAGVEQIRINSQELTIMTASVVASGSTVNIVQGDVVYDNTYNFIHLNLASPLAYNPTTAQEYTIDLSFQGTLRNDMYGFYRSWYWHDGEVRWMATTQFQATSARAAFPCFDEPSYKATFDVSIERPASYSSWSNMRGDAARTETLESGRQVDYFYTTPVMSTYLLAFIVAEYISSPVSNDQDEIIHEVIARPNAMDDNQGDYALDMGQRLLAEMDEHTGIPFESMAPHIKMTQAAIPDFSAGAMENWGLLTYREAYLMYHPEHTNSQAQQLIAYILSHEIAHMWFGNLVTCEWWDYLWLNEGFARYYQYFLTHWVNPEMGFDIRFITEQVHSALSSDSGDDAHALTSPVSSPVSVSAHFSPLTYNKGAAVIRMTEHLLGFSVHEQGLRNYLTQKSFQPAVPKDLFDALHEAGSSSGALAKYGLDFNFHEYYESWTEQAGSPVLSVSVNHQTGDMAIRQWRFDRDRGYSTIASNWIIPISFASEENPDFSNTKPTHILRDTVTVINRGTVGDQWIILNKQQTGYYRVNYDDYTWSLILRALRSDQRTQIHEFNRAQIIDDVCQLSRAGLLDYETALNMFSFLEYETAYGPWIAFINCMGFLQRRLINTRLQVEFETKIASWSDNLMEELTYTPIEGETWMRSYLRHQMGIFLCGLNVRACRDSAVQQFAQLRATPSVEVPVDNRQWVYCNALREGTADDFNFLWDRFLSHNVKTEKNLLLGVLGCTRDEASLGTFLNSIMSDTTQNWQIRPQDYNTAMTSARNGNNENPLIVFNWIRNNLPQFTTTFTRNQQLSHLNNTVSRFTLDEELQVFETWLQSDEHTYTNDDVTILQNHVAFSKQLMEWSEGIFDDVESYLVNGNQEVELTTQPPVEPTDPPATVVPPEVVAPEVPEWDGGGAASLTTSIITMLLALAAGVFANRQ